ncbi:MAG: helix-turn-helix transcriptional regulator [Ilumatobacteraceae bacterium]|jgi:DNA-binding transcriptional ArsR family regulator|nr:helix-turn-helix transcriptional regulator [Ilumatobacteraceae bacterium]MBP8209478.1 helix-turn-helix transcriptional regulator [Ilumatobacteraceae bacterium]MBP9053432.1 helix-turn-helix transcriptional regulator [Ilumatobacteraceae bacterium]
MMPVMAVSRKAPVVDLDVCPSHCDEPAVPLDALRGRVSGREAHVEAAELFRLLGDPTRLAILHALLEGGELCVCDLARVAGVAENVVSQAMRLLRAADVVRTRRDGRRIHYRLADAHVRLLLDLSADHVRHQELASGTAAPLGAAVERGGRRVG